MALIKCPECSKEISDKALACPQCGFPLKSNISLFDTSPPAPVDKENTQKKSKKNKKSDYFYIQTRKQNGKVYAYLEYRDPQFKIVIREKLPLDYFELSDTAQKKCYLTAKKELKKKLQSNKYKMFFKKDIKNLTISELIDYYLQYIYETKVVTKKIKRSTFDSMYTDVPTRIKRHKLVSLTLLDLIKNPRHIKNYFSECVNGFEYKTTGGKIASVPPASKSTIDKDVIILTGAFSYALTRLHIISYEEHEILKNAVNDYKPIEQTVRVKKRATHAMTKYELDAFKNEVLNRLDAPFTYKDLFYQELDKRLKNKEITSLQRAKISGIYSSYMEKIGKANMDEYNLYYDIHKCVAHILENDFMPGTTLYYPITRFYRSKQGILFSEEDIEKNISKAKAKPRNVPAMKNKVYDATLFECPFFMKNDKVYEKESGTLIPYADRYTVNRANTPSSCINYYATNGSLNAYILLFVANTALRISEALSIQVKHIKGKFILDNSGQQKYIVYLDIEEQISSVKKRNDDGSVVVDEYMNIVYEKIKISTKSNASIRKIPLNDTACNVLKIVSQMTGVQIFNQSGEIIENNSDANKFIWINYAKVGDRAKRNGYEKVYLKYRQPLTYSKLQKLGNITADMFYYDMKNVSNKESSAKYYFEQLQTYQNAGFCDDKEVYVMKYPSLPSVSNINKTLKIICKNMHLASCSPKEFTVHDLRHSAATIIYNSSKDLVNISKFMGHSNTDITKDVYIEKELLTGLALFNELD